MATRATVYVDLGLRFRQPTRTSCLEVALAVLFDIPSVLRSTFVRQLDYHPVLPSTSDTALALLRSRQAVELPLLVLAARQTRGRGRGDHRWWSGPGGLTFSLVLALDPVQLPADRRALLGLAAGVALADGLSELVPDTAVALKWPNDLYLAGAKTGGILVESPSRPADRAVIGVGLNVNNSLADAPAELWQRATSLADATGRTFDLNQVLIGSLRHLEDRLAALAQRPEELIGRWRQRCLLTGRRLVLQTGTRRVQGRCSGVDDQGRLLLETATGTQAFASASVEEIES